MRYVVSWYNLYHKRCQVSILFFISGSERSRGRRYPMNLLQELDSSLDLGRGVLLGPPENRRHDGGQFFQQGSVHLSQQAHQCPPQDQIAEVDHPLVARYEFDLPAGVTGVTGERRIGARLQVRGDLVLKHLPVADGAVEKTGQSLAGRGGARRTAIEFDHAVPAAPVEGEHDHEVRVDVRAEAGRQVAVHAAGDLPAEMDERRQHSLFQQLTQLEYGIQVHHHDMLRIFRIHEHAAGERRFVDEQRDMLLNPSLLVEVLSPSTEAYDRGKKFEHYRSIESLREYLLVASDRVHVDQYTCQPDGRWLLTSADRLEDSLDLQSIGCRLALADLYEKVDLPGSQFTSA